MDANQVLILRDNAKCELEKIKSVEEGMTYLNKLSAIDVWVKAEKKDAELQNIVAEQKLRTQRILGKLIREGQQNGGIASAGGDSNMPDRNNRKQIPEIGLTHKQSSTFQQIASIPDETFEEFITEKKEAVKDAVAELTTSGALRLARSLKEQDEDFKLQQEADSELRINKELKTLAKELKSRYTPDQINLLIKHLSS